MLSDQDPLILTDDARQSAARAMVGATLRGKWRLNNLIAVGGMGAVYDATHRNGMRGAVKILDPFLSKSLAARRRFLREGRLANRVRHPGAVRVLDDDEAEDGTAYLVMELLNGATLETMATQSGGKLEPANVMAYGLQVLDTLAAAHASGIVHRDIKPENLFLTNDGVVKILDFGIAGMLAKDGSPMLSQSSREPIGTPAFMAPEQARGRWDLVDHQSDLYSLGASLFTLMTGKLVHEASTIGDMLVLAITRNPHSLGEAIPDAPKALVRAIDGALRLNKSERWPNAAAMRGALQEGYLALKGNSGGEVGVARRVRRLIQTPFRSWSLPSKRWLVSLALVGVAGITLVSDIQPLGVAVAATEPPTPPSPAPQPSARSPASPPSTATSSPATARRYDPIYDRRH